MVAHLPLLVHADPEDVLVIGLASGISVGAVASHPVRSIRVVEVEATIVEAARYFSEANGDVLVDPRLEVSINDARNDLQFGTRTYDVIASQPSNPWMTVASNLFTEDFFRMARIRLKPGGIFCQWIQTYSLRPEDFRSILVAFHAVFPHVLVFDTLGGVDLLLLGSEEALSLDPEQWARRMADPRVRADLARASVDGPLDVLAMLRAGELEVDRLVQGGGSNTDDNARVEFSAPKALFLDTQAANLGMLDRLGADPVAYLSPQPDRDGADRLRLDLARAWLARGERRRAAAAARSALEGPHAADAQAVLERAGTD
jgi:spermidine synthase